MFIGTHFIKYLVKRVFFDASIFFMVFISVYKNTFKIKKFKF